MRSIRPNRSQHPIVGAALERVLRPKARKTSAPLPEIDFDAVPIDKGIPLPLPGRAARDWPRLLGRMAPGDSAVLPRQLFSSLSKTCTDARKAGRGTFTIHKLSESELRVWRKSRPK